MTAFNARQFMEQAIEIMRKSISESRADGKVSPKVGAVLVDLSDDVSLRSRVSAAYRGELRQGDHAEYTLLERKNRDRTLDNCVLFATLEPCAPKARMFPKLGCAERIVLARIKKVWVGIEDPDPTVDRKGIKYLQDNGVEVSMFDRDLQDVIRKENQKFIEQALERAATEEKPHEIVLSPLESTVAYAKTDEFSKEALQDYCTNAKISESINSPEFIQRLARQNLLKFVKKQAVPTGFGMLLFGKEPRTSMPQAGLLATIHYPDGTEEVKDFEGPQVLVPQELFKWLTDKLPNIINRTQARRTNKNEALFELIREGVVNALVHRDYGIAGAKCQIVITEDTIVIKSPGRPIPPITLKNLQSFDAPMLSRNPVLHFVFAKMDLAEERGLGLKSMRQRAVAEHMPLPRYIWEDPYLVLTLFLHAAATTTTLPPETLESLSTAEQTGWQWLSTKGRTKSAEYAEAHNLDVRTARRHLKHFVDLGLIRTIGSGPATEYEVA